MEWKLKKTNGFKYMIRSLRFRQRPYQYKVTDVYIDKLQPLYHSFENYTFRKR